MKNLLSLPLLLISFYSAHGAVVAVGETSNTAGAPSFTLNHGYTPSTTDLINGLTGIPTGDGNFTLDGGSISALTNGAFPSINRNSFVKSDFADGGFNPAPVVPPVPGVPAVEKGGQFMTYTLVAPATINTINVYSGWQDGGRDGQRYNIYFATVSNPTFQLLNAAPLEYSPTGPPEIITSAPDVTPEVRTGTPSAAKVIVSNDDGSGILGTEVTGIRFEFLGTEGANLRYSGYAEIDVFGTLIPEPSSAALLGVAMLGIFRRRR